MLELTKAEDLVKAGTLLGSFFAKRAQELEKNFAFHKAVATHHDAMAKAHTAFAAQHKALHAGLEEDHVHKAFHAAGAAHHEAMATHHDAVAKAHDAHAETMKADVDHMKALASDMGGPTVKAADGTPISSGNNGMNVAVMLQQTSEALMQKTLATFETDPVVIEKIREMALKQIGGILGDKIVPDKVRGIVPEMPRITPVPRHGQRDIEAEKAEVPLELEKVLAFDDQDDEL